MPHSTLSASRRQRTSESEARAPFSSFRSNDGDPFNEDSTPYTTYGAGAGSVAASPSTSPCASVSPPAGLSPETNALCAQAPSAAASFTRKVTAWLPQRKSSSPAGTLIPLESKRSKADAAGTKGKAAHAVPPLQLVGRINADNAAASQRGTSITLRSPTFIVTPRGAVPVSPRVGMTTTATTPVATTPTPRNPPTTRPRSLSSAPMVPVRHQTTPPPVLTAGSKSSGIAAAAAATGAASTLPRQGASATHEPFLDAQPAVPPKMRLSGEGGCIISSSSNHNNGAGQPSAGSPAEAAAASSSAIGKPTPVVGNHARATARRSVSRSCSTLCFVTDTSASSALASLEEEELRPNAARPPFFSAAPARGDFVAMIEWLLCRGEQRDIGLPPASVSIVNGRSRSPRLTPPPPTFFTEDNITKLCTAATQVLSAEPGLLELDVPADDTLIVVGDIHGQFQDLYTSVLCQQYDRRRCNPGGLDRHFLFMGDYVDRGPHSLEVVLLLLALKVEYPSLVYLTRGNHEEEKTSRVYGFLTEATSSLGAVAGGAVWSAVNKVFLDLPLAAIVQTPHMRFFVTHGGLYTPQKENYQA
ncbi:putative phosphoprotein phosphatase [Leptomonas pyrrhocoris]|uniref:Putative phosphoprotein phosphatase n=1 Tax=Leptomonas pyrrhocoris TaxID=157538 RepID=A0A0M9FUV9_LEPPY|nr:putative phosphoprotein phosphatase [Leptomonas pyrrhocoris]KPA76356.1 putative phosphoprotein phosphatase [Leptomonas pyrrhocoris]|eukprot:XP_015654795.1 putative phosphoprotein phosphatase [Leptomonas pyrrhocoris]